MRSKCRCSMCPAIHINSRSWLRSSSTHEPSDPPPKVVSPLVLYSLRVGIPPFASSFLASKQESRSRGQAGSGQKNPQAQKPKTKKQTGRRPGRGRTLFEPSPPGFPWRECRRLFATTTSPTSRGTGQVPQRSHFGGRRAGRLVPRLPGGGGGPGSLGAGERRPPDRARPPWEWCCLYVCVCLLVST